MKIGLVSEEGIGLLVDHFYAKVRVDPVLGPIFERVVRGKWGPHLETMRNFWSSVMLTSGRYKGAPVPAHLRVKGYRAADVRSLAAALWRDLRRAF